MNKELSNKIIVLMLVFTIWMVIYHSNFIPVEYSNKLDKNLYTVFFRLIYGYGYIVMKFFFQTSSFLLYYNINDGNCKAKMKRRLQSLLIPYILWNFIALVMNMLSHGFIPSLSSIFDGFTFEPFDGPLWYVLAIYLLSLLAPLVLKLKKSNTHILLGILLFCYFIFLLMEFANTYIIELFRYGYYFSRLITYLPAYILGMLLGLFFPYIFENSNKKIKWIAQFLVLGSFVLIGLDLSVPYDSFLPILIIFSIPNINGNLNISRHVIFKLSFIIYSVHGIMIPYIKHIFALIPYFNTANGIFSIAMRFMCVGGDSIFIIAFLHYW